GGGEQYHAVVRIAEIAGLERPRRYARELGASVEQMRTQREQPLRLSPCGFGERRETLRNRLQYRAETLLGKARPEHEILRRNRLGLEVGIALCLREERVHLTDSPPERVHLRVVQPVRCFHLIAIRGDIAEESLQVIERVV